MNSASEEPLRFEADVAIIGAGPAGLLLANLLGRHGVRTLVIERSPDRVIEARAAAIDVGALRAVQAAGLYEEAVRDLVLGFDATWTDARGREMFSIHLGPGRLGHPELSSCDQPLIERTLAQGLERFPHVALRMGFEAQSLRQDARSVRIEGMRTERRDGPSGRAFVASAAFVVGCDGADSLVRRASGIGAPRAATSERWLVIDTIDSHLADTFACRFFCDPARPGMTLRQQHARRRWEWRLLPGESEAAMLDEATLRRLLSPWTLSDQIVIERRRVHVATTSVATRWREGRVLLAGDAAHVVPPFAGRGLSAGLQDALDIAWRLALVVQGRAGEKLLDAYEHERRRTVERATRSAVQLGSTMQSTGHARAALRDAAFTLLRRSPAALAFLQRRARRALRPPRLRSGTFVARAEATSRRASVRRTCRAGAVLVQPRVRRADGSECLLDDVLGSGFSVIGMGLDPAGVLDEKTYAFWRELGATFVRIVPGGEAPHGDAVQDGDGTFDRWLGGRRDSLLMVRPDRVVALDTTPERAAADSEAFRRLLGA
jgi:3-(3-hydroxy-phenyl)propionate hydroxylase